MPRRPRGAKKTSIPRTHKIPSRGKDALDRVAAPSSSSERDQRQQETKQNPPSVAGSAVQASRKVPEDFHARKIFIQEKAALLRNTLQTAMQSVTDHQIDRRVSDLEEHSRKVPPNHALVLLFSPPCLVLPETHYAPIPHAASWVYARHEFYSHPANPRSSTAVLSYQAHFRQAAEHASPRGRLSYAAE
ncbi:hypothetical protein N7470_002284 [Penicillium chermesinum]|nr:hypothetical protein N7470_002284 [Penicillium chermesinum]